MQTFLPHLSFYKSAQVLDSRRLGCQIKETDQILNAIENRGYGWQNHPAVYMWRGYYTQLIHYGVEMYRQWIIRFLAGIKGGKMFHKNGERIQARYLSYSLDTVVSLAYPHWLNEQFCSNHRAALLYKDPDWYTQFGWTEMPLVPDERGRLPYLWPSD